MSVISSRAPALSVVMPVRNGMPFVRDAVASILSQSYADFELLVVNDGSTDGSSAWAGSLDDRRVRVLDSAGTGVVAALNTGVFQARGELLARHDADDLSHPERFAVQLAFLRDHPGVDVLGTLVDFIDECGEEVVTPWVTEVRRVHDVACSPNALGALLPLTCGLVHGSVLARTSVVQAAGGYRPEFEWAEDYDLWLRLLPRHRFAKVPQRLYRHRLHSGQVSRQKRLAQLRRTITAKLEYIGRCHSDVRPGIPIMVQGDGRGAAVYRRVATDLGLTLIDACDPASVSGQTHVIVVSDLAQLERWRAQLPEAGWHWKGNIAVRGPGRA